MRATAFVLNAKGTHRVTVATGDEQQSLDIPAKHAGGGSGVNGGEFLMLALATCYCNDLYREARRLGLVLDSVEVEASADFEGIGLAASNVRYRARIGSAASAADVSRLLRETDAVAEIHNTLRDGAAVVFEAWAGEAPGRPG